MRDLGGDMQRDAFRHRDDVGRRSRHGAERLQPVDVFHRHELDAVDQAVVQDGNDAAVMHAASEARLLEEHAPALAVPGVLGQEALDRDPALEAAMPEGDGFHHLRHPTARDGSDETITLGRFHGRDLSANLCRNRFRSAAELAPAYFACRRGKASTSINVDVQKSTTNAGELSGSANILMKSSAAGTNKSPIVAQRL